MYITDISIHKSAFYIIKKICVCHKVTPSFDQWSICILEKGTGLPEGTLGYLSIGNEQT